MFIVAHELGWASTKSRPWPPLCSIRNNSIVKSQQGIQSLCKWLHQLCPNSGYEVELEKDPVDEDEDGGGGGSIDEFDRVDISEGVDGMHDEDIFEAEEVMDESNIYKWGGMSVV